MSSQRVLVVLDDDPTGTQTVHDVPVLTKWSVSLLAAEMARSPVFFILTNSRGVSESAAVALALELGANLATAAQESGVQLEIVSRGDSTMRGHYPAEVNALAKGLGWEVFDTSIIPYFGPGGRLTEGDVHYVHTSGPDGVVLATPVGETEFAKDATFGFTSSNLRDWVEEKTDGRIAASSVISMSLEVARSGTIAPTLGLIDSSPAGSVFVVNATRDSDLNSFCAALDIAAGRNWIHRTAASFVSVRSRMKPQDLLSAPDFSSLNAGDAGRQGVRTGGLVVVGSHTNKTSQQMDVALELEGVTAIELEVDRLNKEDDGFLSSVSKRIDDSLAAGQDVLLYTSRLRRTADSPEGSLALSRNVSMSVCRAVSDLKVQPSFLITKGGITSSDIATEALGIERAVVLGQIQPGVPVWEAESASRFPGLRLVIYPGNVGNPDGLSQAIRTCRG